MLKDFDYFLGEYVGPVVSEELNSVERSNGNLTSFGGDIQFQKN